MKVLLVAVNAKYIHSNLAVYCLKSYAASKGYAVELAEYTINQQPGEVLRDLYERNADVVAFSCYIWNIEFIKNLIKDYKKVRPDSELWLGGPEVSYRGEALLKELPEVRGVMVGEGEETFAKLIGLYEMWQKETAAERQKGTASGSQKETAGKNVPADGKALAPAWEELPGIVVCKDGKEILTTKPAPPLDFSRLPFPYGDGNISVPETVRDNSFLCKKDELSKWEQGLDKRKKTVDNQLANNPEQWNTSLDSFKNRIIYYESSRGCPFSCAYCLSAIDKRVRFRDMDLVKRELNFFLDMQVPQVKFIDRTFNVNGPRTMELLRFIKENDNGITNFHCEIAAELLTAEQIELLRSLRPGLVQLEIGVQSTNVETLEAVNRKAELALLKEKVVAVREKNNVHIHLDLIAGLPKEDLLSFKNSFNEVYRMRPHQLQLGFLKVLSGAPMEQMAAENDILYQSTPPYEVLSTRWLSFGDIILLKKVEELVEIYYNSGQFVYSMMYLQHFFDTPFALYEALAEYYEEQKLVGMKISRNRRYEILLEFAKIELQKSIVEFLAEAVALSESETHVFEEILFYDYCLREKPKSRPAFAVHSQLDKHALKEAYHSFGVKREEEGMHDIEKFSFDPVETAEQGCKAGEPCRILFSYEKKDAMYGQATTRQW